MLETLDMDGKYIKVWKKLYVLLCEGYLVY